MSIDIENQKRQFIQDHRKKLLENQTKLQARTKLPDFNFSNLENDQDGDQKEKYQEKIKKLIEVHIEKLKILINDNEILNDKEFKLAEKIKDLEKREKELESAYNIRENEAGEFSRKEMRIEQERFRKQLEMIGREKILIEEEKQNLNNDIDKYKTEIEELKNKLNSNETTIQDLQNQLVNLRNSGNLDATTQDRANQLEKEIVMIKNYNTEKNSLFSFIDEKIRKLNTSSDDIFSEYVIKKKLHEKRMFQLTKPNMLKGMNLITPDKVKEIKLLVEEEKRRKELREQTQNVAINAFGINPQSTTSEQQRPDSPLSDTSVLSRDFNSNQQAPVSVTSEEIEPEFIKGNFWGEKPNPKFAKQQAALAEEAERGIKRREEERYQRYHGDRL